MNKKINKNTIIKMKRDGKKIAAITSYDYLSTRLIDQCDIDIILVGDSLGMVLLGYENTLPVTMDEMIHHLKAVSRARPGAMVCGDLPFMSFQASVEDAVRNAGRMVKEGGAESVKLEGGGKNIEKIRAIISASIPVMGHIGLTPQSIYQFGGYKVQGRGGSSADMLYHQALDLEEAGCFSIVLECIPWQLAERISDAVSIPTIGIGAGKFCDGQIIVLNDMMGMQDGPLPKYVKQYDQMGERIKKAVSRYVKEVRDGEFPDLEHSYSVESSRKPQGDGQA